MRDMAHISIEHLDLPWFKWLGDADSDLLSLILWIWPLSTTLQSDSQRAQVQFGDKTQRSKYSAGKKHFEMDADKAKPWLVLKRIFFCRLRYNVRTEEKAFPRANGPLVLWMYRFAAVITSLSCHYCHDSHFFAVKFSNGKKHQICLTPAHMQKTGSWFTSNLFPHIYFTWFHFCVHTWVLICANLKANRVVIKTWSLGQSNPNALNLR